MLIASMGAGALLCFIDLQSATTLLKSRAEPVWRVGFAS
jgi:hypothetical protein